MPEQIVQSLPTVTELESLPLHQLSPRDAERLFLRLLESEVDVIYAKSYGVVGQDQEGIDVYGRLRTPEIATGAVQPSSRSPYVALQSKRVETVAPADIRNAVTKFLDGTWAPHTKQFIYATTFDFRERNLDKAVREASERLEAKGVEFVPWDAEKVNELLRSRPLLVARFFNREWVSPFCGADSASTLPSIRLSPDETRHLKAELRSLYRAAFDAFASLRAPAGNDSFVILDVQPRTESTNDGLDETEGAPIADTTSLDDSSGEASDPASHSLVTTSRLRRPRPSLRTVAGLLDTRRDIRGLSDVIPVDVWLADGDRSVLLGAAGAGKSTLLRFVATDLLNPQPRSIALQRAHGDRLPLWLPFGFLCRHLDENSSHSLTSAVHAWLASQGRPDLSPLVDEALEDDRLLLLLDGIDEWTTEATANDVLGKVETFLGSTEAAVIMTSRPYALSGLPLNLSWRRADLAPLDPAQRRAVAALYLVAAESERTATESSAPRTGSRQATWSATVVEPFLAQIDAVPELEALCRTPLLLALLARTWRGEPLPPRRFDLYDLVVKMLVDTHPKMRARASKATAHSLTMDDFQTLLQGVAYRLKVDKTPQPAPYKAMQKTFEAVLSDPEILGFSATEARTVAAASLQMAEDEFGILMPQGAKHVAFVHRVIGDHLAGRHLAELSHETQRTTLAAHHRDASWTDALLATLNAQPNKQTVAAALDDLITEGATHSSAPWPQDILNHQGTWRFLAAALAADVSLAPTKVHKLLDAVAAEVEASPSLSFRAELLTSLVHASSTPTYWRHLQPIFKRWLDATRPYPAPAIRALRELPSSYDTQIRNITLQALRHDDSGTRLSAVDTFVTRFGNPQASALCSTDAALLQVINDGPDTTTQCAALMALSEGWPTDSASLDSVAWARQSPKANLRTAALHAVAQADRRTPLSKLFTAEELDFVLGHLHSEQYIDDHDWTSLSSRLVMRAVTESSQQYKDQLADFVVTTLRQNPMSGGNRSMCWQLACGPLSDQQLVHDWVIEELSDTTKRFPFILYDLSSMPAEWATIEPLTAAISERISDLNAMFRNSHVRLARFLDAERARDALLAAIDDFRPSAAAHALIDRFGTDPIVVATLNRRFADDEMAAKLADVALRHLGPAAGFARIYELLIAENAKEPTSASEAHVVLALAVAYNWYQLQQAAAGKESQFDAAGAQVVLDAYDDATVASACMAVPTRRGLGWHIADIINTWPTRTIDYTIEELKSDDHITQGIEDSIHAIAIRAHVTKPSPRSDEVLDLALDLLTPLPAALREVLSFELAKAPITPAQLIDVTSAWHNDPDDGVRRVTAVGITEAIQRHQAADSPRSPELTSWCEVVREDLRAYGPHLDEDRQIAWICMLLLNAPELLDGLVETINEPKRPGVRLTDIYGNPDTLLATLIAENWENLVPHLDERPIVQLSGVRPRDGIVDPGAALAALLVSPTSPGIATLLSEHIATEEAQTADSATRRLIESTPAGIDHLIESSGASADNLRHIIAASSTRSISGDLQRVYERWAFRRLTTTHWDVTDAELASILREAADPECLPPGVEYVNSDVVSAAHDLLFPHSETARERLQRLTDWFVRDPHDRPAGAPTSWIEATVLAIDATPADHLPAYVARLFNPRRLEIAHEPMWKFTEPLAHRITTDMTATSLLIEALDGRNVSIDSPLFELAESPGTGQSETARRVFVIARALQGAGRLDADALAKAFGVLCKADQRTTVVDPYSGATGPLRTLGVALAAGAIK